MATPIEFRVEVDHTELDRVRAEAKRVERALIQLGDTGSARTALEARIGQNQPIQPIREAQKELGRLADMWTRVFEARERAQAAGAGRIQASRLDIDPEFLEQAAGTAKPQFGQIDLAQTDTLLSSITAQAGEVYDNIKRWSEPLFAFEPQVKRLENEIQELAFTFERVAAARERALQKGGGRIQISDLDVPPNVLERAVGTSKPQFGQVGLDQALDVMRELEVEGQNVNNQIEQWKQGLAAVSVEFAKQAHIARNVRSEVSDIAQGGFLQRGPRAASAESVNLAVKERLVQLEEHQNALIERREALQRSITDAVGGKEALRLQEQLATARKQEEAALRRVNRILNQRVQFEERLRKAGSQRVAEVLDRAQQTGQPVDVSTQGLEAEEAADLRRFTELTNELTQARTELANVRERAVTPRDRFGQLTDMLGQRENLAGLTRQIHALNEQIVGLAGPGRAQQIDLIAPGLLERMQRLRQVLKDIELARAGELTRTTKSVVTGEEVTVRPDQAEALRNLVETREKLIGNIQAQQKQLAQAQLIPVDEIVQNLKLPALERNLINAFSGMGRRFQATLQFALSGALIFSLQRFARHAFETAVDVERAFEDIATALEFDVDFDRTTAQFRAELESIRVSVVQAADEFNVLPTVANEIAFSMVSRFRDVDNAMTATRAQMLAVQVSTIDTQEVIRALTATAEAFAAQTFEVNEGLELQERLLKRETAAAQIQQKVLDLATTIQQKWGVTLEDTVEGTARSAEVFRQLGFSMEETAAIISSVSFQLGQTGTNVAERLNRSIGQITSGDIRDQLLNLAVASKEFTLTFDDFETGATALEALSRQFERLQEVEPETARQIAQIVGQRREIEVVTSVLGSRDFQQEIIGTADEAAGAAERRFQFLEQTMAQILESIGGQFEELVQNMERLGAASPFKIVLKSLDTFLNIINEILKALGQVRLFFERIPIVGQIAKWIPEIIAVSTALGGVHRLMVAISRISLFQGAQNLLTQIMGAAGAAGAAGAVTRGAQVQGQQQIPGLQSIGALSGVFVILEKGVSKFARLAESAATGIFKTWDRLRNLNITNIATMWSEIKTRGALTAALTAQQRLALGFAGAFARIAATIAIGTIVIKGFTDALSSASTFIEEYEKSVKEADREVRSRHARGEIDDDELELELARNRVQAAEETPTGSEFSTAAGNVFIGAMKLFSAEFRKVTSNPEEVKRRLELGGADSAFDRFLTGILPFEARRSIIPGSEEFARATRNMNLPELMEGLVAQINEDLLGIDLDPEDFENRDQRQRLVVQGNALFRNLAQATTNEEVEAAEDAIRNWILRTEEFIHNTGNSIEALEITLESARKRMEEVQTDLDFGRTSPETAAAEFGRIREELLRQAEATSLEDHPGVRDEFLSEAENALRKQSDAIIQGFEKRAEFAELFLSEEDSLRKQIDLLRAQERDLRDIGDHAAADQTALEIIRAQRSLTEFLVERAKREAQFADQFARTMDERIKAQRKLARQLLAFSFRAALEGDLAAAEALAEAAAEASIQAGRLVEERDIRQIVAEARRAGPILSEITRINAELAGLRAELARLPVGSLEYLETENEINQLIAQRAQELLRRFAASALLQAGVNNSVRNLQAQITITAKELQVTADLYGRESAEYLELLLRQDELQTALANAQLELRDLQRRLDSDVTNAFEQAQLDLVAVLEKLTAPDLGELEKARLELEKKNAEAAAQKAFFDDQLFNLEFQFETGEIGEGAYIAALEKLLDSVDITTQQGKEIFLQIQGIIDGLTSDVSDMQFNVPTAIRLPTIFEVRRSLAADQMGVNYQDNRQQDVRINVSEELDLEAVLRALVGAGIDAESSRFATGGAGITIGGFN